MLRDSGKTGIGRLPANSGPACLSLCFVLLFSLPATAQVPERLHCAVEDIELRLQEASSPAPPRSVVQGEEFQVTLPAGTLAGGPFRSVANVPALRQSFEHRDKYSIAVEVGKLTGILELARTRLPSGWSFVARFEGWHARGDCEGGPA